MIAGFRAAAAGAALALLAACDVSEEQEVALGRQAADEIAASMPLVRDPAVTEYVSALGLHLARRTGRPDLDWRFAVVNSDQINAFALPGGFVYLNRGLIERAGSLAELAGVLGHEVGHVALRHSAEQLESQQRTSAGVGIVCSLTGWCESGTAQIAIQVAGQAWFAKHSREDEREADSVAVVTLASAGYDPEGVPDMFARLLAERARSPLGVEQWFASHPLEEDRIAATRAHVERLDPAALEGLVRDDEAFRAFRARVAALPPAPAPAGAGGLPPG
jgi:predicted Zn-dependent protease